MHFDVVLSEFIHHDKKAGGETVTRLSVCARASDVVRVRASCAENFSHSARLLLQQSWAFLYARLVPSGSPYIESDTWDWTRTAAVW